MYKRIVECMCLCCFAFALMTVLTACSPEDMKNMPGKDTIEWFDEGRIQMLKGVRFSQDQTMKREQIYVLYVDGSILLDDITKYSISRGSIIMITQEKYATFNIVNSELTVHENLDEFEDSEIQSIFRELLSP